MIGPKRILFDSFFDIVIYCTALSIVRSKYRFRIEFPTGHKFKTT